MIRIFVSSPGDVSEERALTARVITRLGAELAGHVELQAIYWEHEPLSATASFQDQIIRPSEADIVVCILWSRLGRRLPPNFHRKDGSRYESGTEFEFEDALAGFRKRGRPFVLVYRKTVEPMVSLDDRASLLERLQQREALDAFTRRWFHDESDGSLRFAYHDFESAGEFEDLLDIHIRKLITRILPGGDNIDTLHRGVWREGSPFRGLKPFRFEHAPVFFGRTRATAGILEALRRNAADGRAFVLVLGMSGCGKSSIVRAGVVPMMVQPGVIERVSDWRRVVVRPSDAGRDIVGGFASALSAGLGISSKYDEHRFATALSEQAEMAAGMIGEVLREEAGNCRAVVVIDQLEEIFTLRGVGDEERQRFIAALHALATSGHVWILATMRNVFYPRLARFEKLLDLKKGAGQYDLRPPTPTEISQAIRLPARVAGLRFEEEPETGARLDDVLRDAAAEHPEVLPLLQFTLEELYLHRRDDGTLTHAAYEDMGRLEGSLSQRAEKRFRDLSPQVKAALPEVLDAVVSIRTFEAEDFGRRSAYLQSFKTDEALTLVKAFVDARLFVSELGADGTPTVSVSHEALLRQWPRARDWIDRNREHLRVRRRIREATTLWEHEGRRADLLLPAGKPVAEASELLASHFDLRADVTEFILRSIGRVRRAGRIRRSLWIFTAVLALAAGAAAILAQQSATTAARMAQEAAQRRQDAQALINFMLGDLRVRLEPLGRLDLLDSVIDKVLVTLQNREPASFVDDELASLGEALRQIGEIEWSKGNRRDALSAFQASLSIALEQQRRNPANLARLYDLGNAWFWVGYLPYLDGDHIAAQEAFAKYLDTAEKLVEQSPDNDKYLLELLYANRNLGAVDVGRGLQQQALGRFFVSASIGRRLVVEQPSKKLYQRELAETLSWLSSTHEHLGNFPAALTVRREAMDLNERILSDDPDNSTWLNAQARNRFLYGELLSDLDDPDAIPALEQALAKLEALAARDPDNLRWIRDLAYSHNALAHAHQQFGTDEKTLSHADAASALSQRLVESDPAVQDWRTQWVTARYLGALALYSLGELDGAMSAVASGLDIAEEVEPPIEVAASLLLLRGRIEATLGHTHPGRSFDEAAAVDARLTDENRDPRQLARWAEIRLRNGDTETARDVVERLLGWGYRERQFMDACLTSDIDLCASRNVAQVDTVK